jgi:hypothetical protein
MAYIAKACEKSQPFAMSNVLLIFYNSLGIALSCAFGQTHAIGMMIVEKLYKVVVL